ncbi:hypothetical protein [Cellulomonas sp. GbtcB1]|uniref:hypothetical protein n=1 Tax=Cellulomonas sp. GbtcB1 TaxID=2824746 RepID=UPI001C306915|nr:hypothetical protein [Cellulomonas sp. GbtcB1]
MFDTNFVVDRIPMRDMARQAPSQATVGLHVTRPSHPLAVQAWIIDAKGRDVQITGAAIAWTARTVHIRYTDHYGREGTVWVWASAVTRS